MEKIYLVMFDNGWDYADYEEEVFAAYEDYNEAVECAKLVEGSLELRQQTFTHNCFDMENSKTWVKEVKFHKKSIDIFSYL